MKGISKMPIHGILMLVEAKFTSSITRSNEKPLSVNALIYKYSNNGLEFYGRTD